MRVVSLVPSWTETLIECGIEVVGRTRFCIHPEERIKDIAVVGGTKDLDLAKLDSLKADLLVLDKEENLAWMKDKVKIPVHVTHVENIQSMPAQLSQLALLFQNKKLQELAERWEIVTKKPPVPLNFQKIPGCIDVLRRDQNSYRNLIYVIWRNPWMAVSRHTFIGSLLGKMASNAMIPAFEEKYPKIDFKDFDPEHTFFLFSSEPFPFAKFKNDLLSLGVQGAIVDGESYSWFGLRSLKFLESLGENNFPP